MSFKSNENKWCLYLYLFFFNSPCVCFMLPQDGSRGCSGWKKRRLQPALWHLGCGHYCNRTGWTTAPYVWPAPHEVESSAILEMKTFFAIFTIKGSKVITSIIYWFFLANSCVDSRISGCSLLSRALFLMTKSNFQPPKLKDKLKW